MACHYLANDQAWQDRLRDPCTPVQEAVNRTGCFMPVGNRINDKTCPALADIPGNEDPWFGSH